MKKTCILFVMMFYSLLTFSQNGFVYTSSWGGIQAAFPLEPTETTEKTQKDGGFYVIKSTVKVPSMGIVFDLTDYYNLELFNGGGCTFWIKQLKRQGAIVKSQYKSNESDITELEIYANNLSTRYKIFTHEHHNIIMHVSGQMLPEDKEVLPFFNSIKIKGISFQNPKIDNEKYKDFKIVNPSNAKSDTIKQIVFVSNSNTIVNMDKQTGYHFDKTADVDNDVPRTPASNPWRFALIIGNEDYNSMQNDLKSESNVDYARNDASAFKEYCVNLLGIPEKNITFLLDATVGQINQGISKLKMLSKASNGKAQLVFYFAGHGLPDEITKEPYLIPIDVSGANVNSGIKLNDLFKALAEYPSERITVFLDACFTGGGRNLGLIASRGVKIKPKEGLLSGNIVVFSSSSGEQSSLPYSDKKHGMFTYYLLKKMQESKGEFTYSDLFNYINEHVSIESILINSKEQNPIVNTSQDVLDTWKSWNFK